MGQASKTYRFLIVVALLAITLLQVTATELHAQTPTRQSGRPVSPAGYAQPVGQIQEAPMPPTPGDWLPDEPAPIDEESDDLKADDMTGFVTAGPQRWLQPDGLAPALQIMLMLTVLSMAPAILLMTTSFIRIVVVLGLLKQAIGAQQLPPSQVITALALFMTLLIMTPVWTDVYNNAIQPYSDEEITLDEAWTRAERPLKSFMSRQIDAADNADDVLLFYSYLPDQSTPPETYDDVPMQVILPAYVLSELKVAFLIGFQVYLPFLILDIVVSSVTISMGMMMLPPGMISLPLKIMLFVLVDGWTLMVGMLLESFVPYT